VPRLGGAAVLALERLRLCRERRTCTCVAEQLRPAVMGGGRVSRPFSACPQKAV
jgi:hypothetical protein